MVSSDDEEELSSGLSTVDFPDPAELDGGAPADKDMYPLFSNRRSPVAMSGTRAASSGTTRGAALRTGSIGTLRTGSIDGGAAGGAPSPAPVVPSLTGIPGRGPSSTTRSQRNSIMNMNALAPPIGLLTRLDSTTSTTTQRKLSYSFCDSTRASLVFGNPAYSLERMMSPRFRCFPGADETIRFPSRMPDTIKDDLRQRAKKRGGDQHSQRLHIRFTVQAVPGASGGKTVNSKQFRVYRYSSVSYIKHALVEHCDLKSIVLPKDLRILFRGVELQNTQTFGEFQIKGSRDNPCEMDVLMREAEAQGESHEYVKPETHAMLCPETEVGRCSQEGFLVIGYNVVGDGPKIVCFFFGQFCSRQELRMMSVLSEYLFGKIEVSSVCAG